MSPANDNSNPVGSVPNTVPFLIENWRETLKHAWSVRLDFLALLLGSLEFAFSVFTSDPPINRWVFAGLGMAVTAASMVVRFIRQRKVSGALDE